MIWGVFNILALTGMLSYGVAKKIEKNLLYWLILNLGLTICFICIFLGFTAPPLIAAVVSAILLIACVGAVPVAFIYIEGHLPTYVKAICGVIIGGGIIVLSIMGFSLGLASNFAVFSFIMTCTYIVLMVIGGALFYQK
jgi:hypothetical protein